MTNEERIDDLQSQVIAYGIAVGLLLQHAPPTMKDRLEAAARSVEDRGVYESLTDKQIEQIQALLRSLY